MTTRSRLHAAGTSARQLLANGCRHGWEPQAAAAAGSIKRAPVAPVLGYCRNGTPPSHGARFGVGGVYGFASTLEVTGQATQRRAVASNALSGHHSVGGAGLCPSTHRGWACSGTIDQPGVQHTQRRTYAKASGMKGMGTGMKVRAHSLPPTAGKGRPCLCFVFHTQPIYHQSSVEFRFRFRCSFGFAVHARGVSRVVRRGRRHLRRRRSGCRAYALFCCRPT